jgi:hypothetical protein
VFFIFFYFLKKEDEVKKDKEEGVKKNHLQVFFVSKIATQLKKGIKIRK